MRKEFLFALLFLFVNIITVRAQGSLKDRLDKLVEEALPETSEVGIAVYDLTDKKPLYVYRENKLCRPASTMKLLTVITALSQQGANEPFTTDVWYKGTIENVTLQGDL